MNLPLARQCPTTPTPQDLIFEKQYDNSLKQMARTHKDVDELLEHESVKTAWDKVLRMLENEKVELAASLPRGDVATEDGVVVPAHMMALEEMRTTPTKHVEGSQQYWRAMANTTVRRYCAFYVEPKTQANLTTLIGQGPLKDLRGEPKKSVVLVWADLDCMSEGIGPLCAHGLRKTKSLDMVLPVLRKLVHGALLGHGAQRKNEEGEATCPAAGDIVMIMGGARPVANFRKDVRTLFRATNNRNDTVDCEETMLSLVFNEESIRSRKARCRGSNAYSLHAPLLIYSPTTLVPECVMEKKRCHFPGYNTGDVVGWINGLAASDMWTLPRCPGPR